MPSLFERAKHRGTIARPQDNALRTLIVCVVLSVALLIVTTRSFAQAPIMGVRSVAAVVAMPVQYVAALVGAPFRAAGTWFGNAGADSQTLSELQEENAKLTSQMAELKETALTAQRLQDLLALKSSYNLQSVAVRIIAGSHTSWESTVTIDKGSAHGLRVGMPVVDSNGAIGQIIECDVTSSVVRLISDEKSSISAMIQSNRAQGIIQGSIDGTVKLRFINTNLEAHVGDIVVTSGLGGIFPKGIPIGKIASVNKTPGSLYYDIRITPLSQTENLEEVLVVTSLTEEQKATDGDMAKANEQDTATNQDVASIKERPVSTTNAPDAHTPANNGENKDAHGKDASSSHTQQGKKPSGDNALSNKSSAAASNKKAQSGSSAGGFIMPSWPFADMYLSEKEH